MKKDLKVIEDPETIKIGIEETRSKILSFLKEDDLTIKDISNKLDKDKSTIYRHVKKLEEHDFVGTIEDDGKRRYTRKAHTYYIDPEYIDFEDKLSVIINWHLDFNSEDLNFMDELGYGNDGSDDLLEDISWFLTNLDKRLENKIDDNDINIDKKDTMTLMRTKLLAYLLLIYNDEEVNDYFENIFTNFNKNVDLDFNIGDDNK